jgi:AcrR family transcriptional regulator
MGSPTNPVKRSPVKRSYDATRRAEAAARTRTSILGAARRLFLERGYAATSMAAIAEASGVALDTVYAAVGRKPAVVRLLVETAISGTSQAVPAEERDYVVAIRATDDAVEKIDLYAAAMREISARLAPLLAILQQAAHKEAELATLWSSISERRAANMRLFAADLAAVAPLRVAVSQAADIVWATNSPELYLLLVGQRGWTPDAYERFLADAWARLLLEDAAPRSTATEG